MSALPTAWCDATLADLGEWSSGGTPSRKVPSYYNGHIPWVKTGDLDHEVVERVDEFLSAEGLKNSAAKIFPKGSLLVAMYGATIGQTGVLNIEAATNQACAALLANGVTRDVIPYVWRYLIAIQDGLRSAGQGGAQANISQAILKSYPIRVAPLPEQRRIVAKIDSLTGKSKRARDHLDHIPRLVEKYKQAVLAAAFRGDLTRGWRHEQLHQPAILPRDATEIRKKYVEARAFVPPYDIPTNWQWLCLPQLGDLDRGKSRHRPRNDKRLFGGSYPFIQTGEVRQADRFLTSYRMTYSDFGLAQSRMWPVGTVCITIAANIAETAILGINACFPDSVVGFLPDIDRADASFVEFFIRTAREALEAFAPATAQKNINLDILATIRVPVAPVAEQVEIVRRIEVAFKWIDRLASEATSARKLIDYLDQTILAKAFRGELVPQNPADEPASVLLERIRINRNEMPKMKRLRKAKV